MAIGLIKGNTVIGLEKENTEGTYVAPSGTTSYVRPIESGFDMQPAREIIERGLLNASPGSETPRMGARSVSANISVEARGSGTEGANVDHGTLIECALGSTRSIASRVTSKATTHTSTVIYLDDTDKDTFNIGDMVVVLEDGAHEMRPISAVVRTTGAASITFPFALDNGAPSSGVELSKLMTWYTANSGHPSASLTYFWGNSIEERGLGLKVSSMALQGFETGKVPTLNFGLSGISYYHGDGAAAHTPAYDSGLPPIILGACVWRKGTKVQVPSFDFSLSNTLTALKPTCGTDGILSQIISAREITGTISPYKDDTTFGYYTDWDAGTEFSLFAHAYIPSATSGEMTMGSVIGFWLPQCIATSFKVADVDGVLVDELQFKATRGAAGDQEELFVGIV